MESSLNELRGDIIDDALSAYWLLGPRYLSSDSEVLRELLYHARHEPGWYQFPESLDQLVTLNHLSHLPESPYPGAEIVSEPAELLPPGTIVYRTVPTRGGYILEQDGSLEFYFLAVIGTPEDGETNPEIIEFLWEQAHRDIWGVVDVIPLNIVYHKGFYPGPQNHYRKRLELYE